MLRFKGIALMFLFQCILTVEQPRNSLLKSCEWFWQKLRYCDTVKKIAWQPVTEETGEDEGESCAVWCHSESFMTVK